MALVHKLIRFLFLWHQLRERTSADARFTARKPCWARSSLPEVFAWPWLTHWSQTGRFNFDCCLHLFDFIDHCARINNRLYWYHLQDLNLSVFFAWCLFLWRLREFQHITQQHCNCSKQKKVPVCKRKLLFIAFLLSTKHSQFSRREHQSTAV